MDQAFAIVEAGPCGAAEPCADLAALWAELGDERVATRPDFRFDLAYYRAAYPDLAGADDAALAAHYRDFGRAEGRNGTLYAEMRKAVPGLGALVAGLLREPRLVAAVAAGGDAAELAFELIALGDPVDRRVADFSAAHYRSIYPDLAGSKGSLFGHYVRFGAREGRRTLAELRRNVRAGARAFDPARRTVIVCAHEFSGTGAPMVARDLAAAAAARFNVVVLALRPGPLLAAFIPHAVSVMWTERPAEELDYLDRGHLARADFAILNSAECALFAKCLVARGIPFASYVHEFAEYSLPAYKNRIVALYSDLVVFSSEVVRRSWAGVLDDAGVDARDCLVVPQAALVPGAVPADEVRAARARLSALLGRDLGTSRIVYGAGFIHWRKGTDLFAMVAKASRDAVFVWIGDGLDHEDIHIGVWIEKHFADAGVNDPEGNFFHLPAGPAYADLCRAADVLFLSSRLDPLPNVVFDAVAAGCSVVLFEGATGFDDARYEGSEALARVPSGDLSAAAGAIAVAPGKRVGAALPVAAPAAVFETIAGRLAERLAALPPMSDDAGRYDVALLHGPGEPAELRAAERRKLWRCGRRAVWRSRGEAEAALAASPHPVHRAMTVTAYDEIAPVALPAYAVHVHAFYPEPLEAELSRAAFRHAARVVVTTDTEEKAARVAAAERAAGVPLDVRVVPNRGRDVVPFLEAVTGADDEIWCHVHIKRSPALAETGEAWRGFLMAILLGGERLSSALALIRQAEVGLVGAFDPYVMGWTGSRRLLPRVAARVPLPDHPLLFPVGNMFWTKAGVVRRMAGLFGAHPWPNEPLPSDGTPLHLVERLWPAVTAEAGLRSVFLDKPGERRV